MALSATRLKNAIVAGLNAVFPAPDGLTPEQLAVFNDARDKFANAIAAPVVTEITGNAAVSVSTSTPNATTGIDTLPGTGTGTVS